MRHALAPGYGDPANFNILDCKTQRNLDQTGIEQSKSIGNIFKDNGIKFTKIFLVSGVGVKILHSFLKWETLKRIKD